MAYNSNAATAAVAKETAANKFETGLKNWVVDANEGGFPVISPEIERAQRMPISQYRTDLRGQEIARTLTFEVQQDLTYAVIDYYLPDYIYTKPNYEALYFTGLALSSGSATVPAFTQASADVLHKIANSTSLWAVRGYGAIDGIIATKTAPAKDATTLALDTAASVAAPAGGATIEIAGVRIGTAKAAITKSGDVFSLTRDGAASGNIDFAKLGLSVGQVVHIGGIEAANQFGGNVRGFARISAISASALTFDWAGTGVAAAAKDSVTADLLFGRFTENAAFGASNYRVQTLTFETQFIDDAKSIFNYATGAHSNQITMNIEAGQKSTVTNSYIALGDNLNQSARVLTKDAIPFVKQAMMDGNNTVGNVVFWIDGVKKELTVQSLVVTIGNNLEPESFLGAKYPSIINVNKLEINVAMTLILVSADIPKAIDANNRVGLMFSLINEDGIAFFDLPNLTINGTINLDAGKPIKINATGTPFRDANSTTAIRISQIPVTPKYLLEG